MCAASRRDVRRPAADRSSGSRVDDGVSASGFSCSSGGAAYEVRRGDGWYAVSELAEVSVRTLLDANGASIDDALFAGDRLCLPSGASLTAMCDSTARVTSGDGWSAIARRVGVPTSSLVALNGGDAGRMLHPGDTICVPEGSSPDPSRASSRSAGDYTVVSGDSWFWIAERAGTSVRSLLEANGASSRDPLHPGQELRLPAGAASPSGSSNGSTSGSGWAELEALPTQGPCWYQDSWGAPRSGGRRHVGTDIFTFGGEYVYAVADGTLTSRKWARPGNISGNAWRLTADDGTAYFYAHLTDFAPDLGVGSSVRAGQIIGWVGKTGNTAVDHLHFEIRPGGGNPVNPYPILRAHGGACNQGIPYRQPGGWVPD
jgi:murein DD-endopeptidase MepM/ murein hydrolase activator NlpD